MKHTLQWTISLALTLVGAASLNSCCCSCGEKAPALRKLPQFQEIPQEVEESPKSPIVYEK